MTGIIPRPIFVPRVIPGPPRAIECADGVSFFMADGTAGGGGGGGGGVDESTTSALGNDAGCAEGRVGLVLGVLSSRFDITGLAVFARAHTWGILMIGLMLGVDVCWIKRSKEMFLGMVKNEGRRNGHAMSNIFF